MWKSIPSKPSIYTVINIIMILSSSVHPAVYDDAVQQPLYDLSAL